MFPRSRISVIPGSTRDLRDDGWEHRRADFGTTDGDKRFAFPGRRLYRYVLAPSSRTRSGTLACPGTYSKRPRYKNNHRWMFPRSRISVIPGSTRDLRDDGWEYRWGDFGTTDGDKRFAFPGRRLSGYILAPSSRTCSGTLTCSGSLARPGVFGTTDGRGLNRNHLITACGFGVV